MTRKEKIAKTKPTEGEVGKLRPAEMRSIIRRGEWTGPNEMACIGYWKANLVVLPKDYAFEFLLFSQRNPKACAVTEACEPGDPHSRLLAPDIDLRTDLPKYRIWENGEIIDEPTDIVKYWRDDLVAFLIGSVPNVFAALLNANVEFRLLGAYSSTLPCIPAGRFYGNMAVTVSIFKSIYDVVRGIQISSRHPAGHGAPIHIGDPTDIGVKDLPNPDIISLMRIEGLCHPKMLSLGKTYPYPQEGEIFMCWGCGVTPQLVARAAKVPFMITHYPGHLLITDQHVEELAIL